MDEMQWTTGRVAVLDTPKHILARIERLERIALATTTTAIGELEVISTEARQQLADRLADDLRDIKDGRVRDGD